MLTHGVKGGDRLVSGRPPGRGRRAGRTDLRSGDVGTRGLAWGGAIAAVCLLLFLVIANLVWAGQVDRMDERVLGWFARRRSSDLTRFFVTFTSLGSRHVLVPLGLGVAIALMLGGRPGMAFAVWASLTGAMALSGLLEIWVERARPDVVPHLVSAGGYAFPSGHAAQSASFWVTLALLVAGHVRGRALRAFLVGYALLIGAIVSLSRMYLGVHYLSDVIAGTLLGVSWALVVVGAEQAIRHRRPRSRAA